MRALVLAQLLTIGCAPTPELVINEVMSRNTLTLLDSAGEADDWIEVKNLGDVDVLLDGLTLGDAAASGPFPAGTLLLPGAFLLVFADDSSAGGTPEEPHVPFKLSGAGDSVSLRDSGGTVIDGFDIPALALDVSFGRSPDGTGEPALLTAATPRASNAP